MVSGCCMFVKEFSFQTSFFIFWYFFKSQSFVPPSIHPAAMNRMGFSWHLCMFLLVRKVSQSKSFEISFKIFIDKSKYLPFIWVLSDSNALYSEIMKHRFKNWFEVLEKPFYFVYQSKYDFKMYDVFHFRRVLNPFSGIVPNMLFVLLGCLLMLAGWLTSISKEFSLGWFESKFNRFSFEEMRGKRCISKFSNASLYWCHASGQAASPILV